MYGVTMSPSWPDDEPQPQPLDVEALLSRKPPTDAHGRRVNEALVREEPSPLGQPLADQGVRAGGYYTAWRVADRMPVGDKTFKDVLTEALSEGVLVELGGGVGNLAPLLRNEAKVTIQHYANIDVISRAEKYTNQNIGYSPRGPDAHIKADVLDALERIPNGDDQDASIRVGAIAVHGLMVSEEKARAIAREAVRVLPVGGILFGIEESKILQFALESGRFKVLIPPDGVGYPRALQKKEET